MEKQKSAYGFIDSKGNLSVVDDEVNIYRTKQAALRNKKEHETVVRVRISYTFKEK